MYIRYTVVFHSARRRTTARGTAFACAAPPGARPSVQDTLSPLTCDRYLCNVTDVVVRSAHGQPEPISGLSGAYRVSRRRDTRLIARTQVKARDAAPRVRCVRWSTPCGRWSNPSEPRDDERDQGVTGMRLTETTQGVPSYFLVWMVHVSICTRHCLAEQASHRTLAVGVAYVRTYVGIMVELRVAATVVPDDVGLFESHSQV